MFGRLGRFVVHNPWKIIVGWIVAAVALVALGPQLSSVTNDNQSSFLPSKYESIQAKSALDAAFPSASGQVATIVIRPVGAGTLSAGQQQKVSDLATTLTGDHIAGVAGVQAGKVAPTQAASWCSPS